MEKIQHLLRLFEVFGAAQTLSETRVSSLVFNDGTRIRDLQSGRDIGVRRLDKAVQWFSDNWPANTEWPGGQARPDADPDGRTYRVTR
jgi:hypothetical protein